MKVGYPWSAHTHTHTRDLGQGYPALSCDSPHVTVPGVQGLCDSPFLGPGWWEQDGLWKKPLEAYKLPHPCPRTHSKQPRPGLTAGRLVPWLSKSVSRRDRAE